MCCQIGAREHYAVPRALERLGSLKELFTDFWARPGDWRGLKSNGRFHSGLAKSAVTASNLGAIRFELTAKTRGYSGWELIQARNDWFQNFVLAGLNKNQRNGNGQPVTLFAYSYAADQIFNFARRRGWTTVLGQIDLGPADEAVVGRLNSQANDAVRPWKPAPAGYWRRWQLECDLADHIVVNSDWSRDGLIAHGAAAQKIKVVPLAFEPSDESATFIRQYPQEFTAIRPLRVLFLGQICLRKGVDALFEAIKLLRGEPIEFWFVGSVQVDIPVELRSGSRIRWIGPVPRSHVGDYYRKADVFIFPTLSDGFGLTQLEAQSWKLPVIASRYCGPVVRHDLNGLVLQEVSARTIADALVGLLHNPDKLQQMSRASYVSDRFSLASLGNSLVNL
ncbi:MAG TPA: glycosyltransferase family 4 protein [Pyrinomonadaceae bacterium]